MSAAGAAMVRGTSMRSVMGQIVSRCDLHRARFGEISERVTEDEMSSNKVDSSTEQPVLLRRAIAFIHDNAHRDITLSDIAASVNVTPRSVQYTFRRHVGSTPLEYLRSLRLNRAHRELQAADPSVDTVMAIAGRWGFGHAGRFSSMYKRTFGTSPSRTLRS
jgi:transcriptional regulator GlxA family with amidase domain